jgi:diacylglycerol kinase
MSFIKSLLKSFYYAFRGLLKTIREERSFRIQLVAIMYVTIFALFYGLNGTQWAILWLTFCMIPALEIINTAIENTVDIKIREQNPNARSAKDLAAAAVLFASIITVIVAICLFSEKDKLLNALKIAFTPPWIIIIALTLFPSFIFIKGGKKDKHNRSEKKD